MSASPPDGGPATFVLVPGAGIGPWYWTFVVDALAERGHEAIAVELPSADDSADLGAYAEAVVAAIDGRRDVAVVAHSLGGFTGPLVCERVPVDLLVLVTAMVGAPGEAPGDWWENTGFAAGRRAQADLDGIPDDGDYTDAEAFYNDVPDHLAAACEADTRGQSGTPLVDPWPLERWPDVPTRFLLCTEDRFFPEPFLRRVVAERLPGLVPDELAAGHLPMLSRPVELADYLARCWAER